MPTMQTRRRFLTTLSLAGAAGLVRAPPALAAEAPLETTTVRLVQELPASASPRNMSPRSCCAPRASPSPLCRCAADRDESTKRSRAARSISVELCAAAASSAIDRGEPITVLAGVHVGCFELFGNDEHPQHHRPEGQERRRAGLGSSQHVFLAVMAAYVGLDPDKDIHWVAEPDRPSRCELFARGQDRRVPRLSARAAGTARPAYRPRDRQQRRGPALVAVFLLHAGRQPRIRPQISGRDQARAARHPQGGRPLRHRAGARRAAARRWRLHRRATTMRCRR